MHAQGIENIRVPRLPFSRENKRGDRTRALASVEKLQQWAKAQAVMLYGGVSTSPAALAELAAVRLKTSRMLLPAALSEKDLILRGLG